MNYEFFKDKVIIKEPKDFSISHTFDCGQCFRFTKNERGNYEGVAFNKPIELYEKDNNIVIENINEEDFNNNFKDFFDLDRDYGEIKKSLYDDEIMKKAIDFGWGIRILKQDFFECLISFIISQQNSIPKIRKTVELLSSLYGEEKIFKGKKFYTFPTVSKMHSLKIDDLAPLRIGYRDKYIIDAVDKVYNREIDYNKLIKTDYKNAKEELLKIKGVGSKVADCVLLFSLLKFEAFPVDTWIKKAMASLYDLKEKEIRSFSDSKFKEYSGFAQQYIFYYIRENA